MTSEENIRIRDLAQAIVLCTHLSARTSNVEERRSLLALKLQCEGELEIAGGTYLLVA